MADNLNITSGAGLIVATDQDPTSSAHYQLIKLVDGNLNSTGATGVSTNPLFVRANSIVQVSGGITIVSSSAITVSGAVTSIVTGGVTLLSSIPINITGTTLISGGVSLLSSGSLLVSGAVTSLITGGVTLLSAIPLNISGTVLVSGGVTLLSASQITVSGSVTALVTGTVTSIVSGGVTLLSASQITVSGSVTSIVTGGVTLLSSAVLTAKRDVINYVGCTPTWIYTALSSNNATSVWIPAANKRFNITDITINCTSASTITITQDTAATITIMKLKLMDRGGWVSNLQTPVIASTTNHALVVTSTESGTNSFIFVSGYESS